MDWVKQWSPAQKSPASGLPQGPKKPGKSKATKGKGFGKSLDQDRSNKRFKAESSSRFQAVERLARSTATLAQRTARQIAVLFSFAIVTLLCPSNPALVSAGAVSDDDETNPRHIQFQKWGNLIKGLSEDPKTPAPHKEVLKAHVEESKKEDSLQGKVLMCRVKPTFRNSEMYLVQFRVSDSMQSVALALIETLVSAGGTVHYDPAPRLGDERQVEDDVAFLDSF